MDVTKEHRVPQDCRRMVNETTLATVGSLLDIDNLTD